MRTPNTFDFSLLAASGPSLAIVFERYTCSMKLFGYLFVLFCLVALEVSVTASVMSYLGFWLTLLIIALTVGLGTMIMRQEGVKIWQQIGQSLQEGKSIETELADTFLVVLGGILLIIPGIFTAILGIICVLKPTRRFLRPLIISKFGTPNQGFNRSGTVFIGGNPFAGTPFGGGRKVVDGRTGQQTYIPDGDYIDEPEHPRDTKPTSTIDVEVVDISRYDD